MTTQRRPGRNLSAARKRRPKHPPHRWSTPCRQHPQGCIAATERRCPDCWQWVSSCPHGQRRRLCGDCLDYLGGHIDAAAWNARNVGQKGAP